MNCFASSRDSSADEGTKCYDPPQNPITMSIHCNRVLSTITTFFNHRDGRKTFLFLSRTSGAPTWWSIKERSNGRSRRWSRRKTNHSVVTTRKFPQPVVPGLWNETNRRAWRRSLSSVEGRLYWLSKVWIAVRIRRAAESAGEPRKLRRASASSSSSRVPKLPVAQSASKLARGESRRRPDMNLH
jgi:hypothetical protein